MNRDNKNLQAPTPPSRSIRNSRDHECNIQNLTEMDTRPNQLRMLLNCYKYKISQNKK